MDMATVFFLMAGLVSVQSFYPGFNPYSAQAPKSVVFRLNLDQGIANRDGAGEPEDILGLVERLVTTFKGDLGVSTPTYSSYFSGSPVLSYCLNPNGVYPDPTACGKYVACGHGVPTSLSCGTGTLYSSESNYCEHNSEVRCRNQVIKGSVTGSVTGSLTGPIEGSIAGSVFLETSDKGKSRSANFEIIDLKYAMSGEHSETAKALLRAALNGEGFASSGILSSFASGPEGLLSSFSSGSVSGTINGAIVGSFKDEFGNIESKTFNFDNLGIKAGGGTDAPGEAFEALSIENNDVDVVGEFGGALRKVANDLGIGSK